MSKKHRLKNQKKKLEKPSELIPQKKDKSPIIPQRTKIDRDLNIFLRELSEKQKKFMELALDKKVKLLLVSGPAGSSKTYISVLASLLLMNDKKISDILYVRSVVESADVKMGTLPGEAEDKLSPYTRPLIDKLDELLPSADVKYLINDERVEGLPIGYLRGLNWNAKAIIGDEMQNFSKKEIVTLITRIGEFCKVFLCGDPQQSDINGRSGFKPIFDLFNSDESGEHGIYTFEFTDDDIVRSALVKHIVKTLRRAEGSL